MKFKTLMYSKVLYFNYVEFLKRYLSIYLQMFNNLNTLIFSLYIYGSMIP